MLINVLIDLDLPLPCVWLEQWRDDRLAREEGPRAHWERLDQLDRQAHSALRRNEPEAAIAHLRTKRRLAIRLGEDGLRELCGLLYAAAWFRPDLAREFAQEARLVLADVAGVLARLEANRKGNSRDLEYLLRAFALWAWRGGDPAAIRTLRPYLDPIRRKLEDSPDSGPWGFIAAFLILYRTGHPEADLGEPSWGAAEARLQQDRYFFELAALSHLLGRHEAAARYLERFQRLRRETLPLLQSLPPWLIRRDWASDLQAREALERDLLQPGKGSPEELAARGLLPM